MCNHLIRSYNFSKFAKSILRRFFPKLPSNWTSTNSVSPSISLLRMMPSPKRLWRTRSPGVNCCPLIFCWRLAEGEKLGPDGTFGGEVKPDPGSGVLGVFGVVDQDE